MPDEPYGGASGTFFYNDVCEECSGVCGHCQGCSAIEADLAEVRAHLGGPFPPPPPEWEESYRAPPDVCPNCGFMGGHDPGCQARRACLTWEEFQRESAALIESSARSRG